MRVATFAQLLAPNSCYFLNTFFVTNNPFSSWIELYGGHEFQQSVAESITHFDQLLAEIDINSERGQRLIKIFKTATRMEVAFWQQGLDCNTSN